MLDEQVANLTLRKIRKRMEELGRYVTIRETVVSRITQTDRYSPCFIYSNITPITDMTLRETNDFEKYADAVSAPGFKPVKAGDSWSEKGKNGWFKISFTLPKSFDGKPAVMLLNLGYEGCVFKNGVPFQGITQNHEEVLLTERAKAGEKYEFVVDAISNAIWLNKIENAQIKRAEIATINREAASLYYTLEFLTELAETLPADSVRRAKLIYALSESVNAFDFTKTDEKSIRESAKRAFKLLEPALRKKSGDSSVLVTCIGHSHIDTAWLWPYAETMRKCARTFSTVVRYMDQYPDYRFNASQIQLYEWTKELYPTLFEEIKKRVKEGRWDPEGAMWVESDMNLTSGESLVRQLLYGKRFYKNELGIDSKILWLPDVFGYSAALPQILKRGGVDYFTTIKLIWGNQFNKPPYSSFWWQGIDGTKILSHLPPSGDYNARINPKTLRKTEDDYHEKDRSEHALLQYGFGDGGGGPAKHHLEHLKVTESLEGLPRTVQRKSLEFFKDLAKESGAFPTWRGELYFEYHRGTYTTQARTKMNNRKSELGLRSAEFLSSVSMNYGGKYPSAEMEKAWKLALKNQFHDVIPGSSVKEVYEDAEKDYAVVLPAAKKAEDAALKQIAKKINTAGDGQAVVVFNTLSWKRVGMARIELQKSGDFKVVGSSGETVPCQRSKDGKTIYFRADVPAMGYRVYRLVAGKCGGAGLGGTVKALENPFFKIKIDKKGLITYIYDKKAGREVVPAGNAANLLQLFEDKPLDWEAWDLDFFYAEKGEDITALDSIEVEESGPLFTSLRIVRSFGSSRLTQRMTVYSDVPRIDFETEVDWQESRKILKAAFPVTVNSENARYEIQFGSVERPTHSNTSWDFARFEVCGHKWADLSEGNYGVSLLNDCKYGHDIRENVMRLSLLRSATDPDLNADRGRQVFTYSLYPHTGDYASGKTVRAGYELNVPLLTAAADSHKGELPASISFFAVDADNVVLDTVKKAEDDNSVILRLYEAHNSRVTAKIASAFPIKKAWECNLLEENERELEINGGEITLSIKPFEIKTIKLDVG